MGRDTDKHSGTRPGYAFSGPSGVFERPPGDLQQEVLLRIDRRSLSRGDVEEVGIELVDAVDEAAVSTGRPSRLRLGIVERVDHPSAWWDFGDCVSSFAQQLPERSRAVGVTR